MGMLGLFQPSRPSVGGYTAAFLCPLDSIPTSHCCLCDEAAPGRQTVVESELSLGKLLEGRVYPTVLGSLAEVPSPDSSGYLA